MLATYKPAEPTPLPFADAAQCMSAALASALNAPPATEVLALALAKTTLEAGRQGEKLWTYAKCWNIGNVKAGPKYSGMYTTYSCNEVLDGKVVWFSPFGRLSGRGGVVVAEQSDNPPGHPQTRFRAYANGYDGAYQYVDFVASGRYLDAWQELLEGDAEGYVRALHRKGYFTADPDVYARGVVSLQREFIAKLQGRSVPEDFIPSVEVVRDLLASKEWNQRESQVLATHAMVESTFDLLEAGRRDALDQMLASDDPNNEQDPDDDGAVSDTDPAPPPESA